ILLLLSQSLEVLGKNQCTPKKCACPTPTGFSPQQLEILNNFNFTSPTPTGFSPQQLEILNNFNFTSPSPIGFTPEQLNIINQLIEAKFSSTTSISEPTTTSSISEQVTTSSILEQVTTTTTTSTSVVTIPSPTPNLRSDLQLSGETPYPLLPHNLNTDTIEIGLDGNFGSEDYRDYFLKLLEDFLAKYLETGKFNVPKDYCEDKDIVAGTQITPLVCKDGALKSIDQYTFPSYFAGTLVQNSNLAGTVKITLRNLTRESSLADFCSSLTTFLAGAVSFVPVVGGALS
ncbi:hypothetical protein HK096_000168, partial [Nowakowskiella sp. JEL0078]